MINERSCCPPANATQLNTFLTTASAMVVELDTNCRTSSHSRWSGLSRRAADASSEVRLGAALLLALPPRLLLLLLLLPPFAFSLMLLGRRGLFSAPLQAVASGVVDDCLRRGMCLQHSVVVGVVKQVWFEGQVSQRSSRGKAGGALNPPHQTPSQHHAPPTQACPPRRATLPAGALTLVPAPAGKRPCP